MTVVLNVQSAAKDGQPRLWWQQVRADIERFSRPIRDPAARSKPDEKPLLKKGRCFCPHEDGAPLKVHAFDLGPSGALERMTLTVYYCEIEGVYWTHLVGGEADYNLVTGPYRLGAGPVQTRRTTRPATQPAAATLRLGLERAGPATPVWPGAPVPLTLVFVNEGAEPLWFNADLSGASLRLEVRGPRVETTLLPAPPAPRGPDQPAPATAGFVRLEPGATHALVIRDLAAGPYRHRLALPGTYLVRATYVNEDEGAALAAPVGPPPTRTDQSHREAGVPQSPRAGVRAWTGTLTSDSLVIQVAGQVR